MVLDLFARASRLTLEVEQKLEEGQYQLESIYFYAVHMLKPLFRRALRSGWQSLYPFTIGGLVKDDHLQTLPPYHQLESNQKG